MNTPVGMELNQRAARLAADVESRRVELRINSGDHDVPGRLLDFGINAEGGLHAGLELARLCMSDLGRVSFGPSLAGGVPVPTVQVSTDAPVAACLLSQYAGWQINPEGYFGMGSGPVRATVAGEELFEELDYRESPTEVVGVIEAGSLPDSSVFEYVAERARVSPQNVTLAVAPTSSQAGNVQVVARSVETAMHKLHELGFDVRQVVSGFGTAPLPPVATNDLQGIGWTNDAILYGGEVTLWVRCEDDLIAEAGPKVPASASEAHGRPFLEIFEAAGRDFYAIDPLLFSPARIVFQNLSTGCMQSFGELLPDILSKSFGTDRASG